MNQYNVRKGRPNDRTGSNAINSVTDSQLTSTLARHDSLQSTRSNHCVNIYHIKKRTVKYVYTSGQGKLVE